MRSRAIPRRATRQSPGITNDAPHTRVDKNSKNGTGECCRMTARPITADILKYNQLSSRDASADRLTD